jgi:class 3 adenylate cyclase/tetratricopeptide (TPR) repeat protein
MTCATCGQPIPAGAHFCPNCGTGVSELLGTEERKLVTVLFADLVDSSGLAQHLDQERAREVMSRFFDALAEELLALRGRPEKFIGDAVMAVFGLPQVHEDDALRAVRAGLAIRDRIHRLGQSVGLPEPLQVRVGIETGEAATGRGPAGQLMATGPVVNVASRLQAAAQPGQVLAGQTTHALTRTAVSYGRRRSIRARGFENPLVAYAVEGLSQRSARRTIPFVGRSGEQAILGQSVGLVRTGGPLLVTVVGEPGIGKSRLADELAAGLSAGLPILRGRPRTYTETATFAPIATIVGDLAGIDDDQQPETVRRRLLDLVSSHIDPAQVSRVTDRLSRLFSATEPGEESAFVHDVEIGFLALIDAIARNQSVLLLFDDVHTLKPQMLDLIERLGAKGRRGAGRLLVLAMARPQLLESRPNWGCGGNSVLIRLDPLSTDESIQLVRQAGAGRIGDADAVAIAARAGGNPYFIVETTGMLLTDGRPPGGQISLPPTVQAVVSARLDALPARLRELARHGSVFLQSFDLAELVGVDPETTLGEIKQLEDAEIVVREPGDMATPRWRLRHATLRDVAYASLPKRERLRIHGLIAKGLLATGGHVIWAADHLELAAIASLDLDPNDRAAPDAAADALLVAGDRARRRTEGRSAVDLYERCLAMAGQEDGWGVREARALAGMGEANYWLGDYAAATEELDRAVTLGEARDDPFTLAMALRFLGDMAINVEGDVDKAAALLERSLAAAEKLGDPWAVVRTLLFAGWVPWTRALFEESEAIWRRALDMAAPKDRWARVRALTSLSINRGQMKDPETAMALIAEAGALAEEMGDLFSIGIVAVQTGRVLDDLERHEESLPLIERGIAIFGELGARWELADARAERGTAYRKLGRLDEAEDDLRYAIRASEELGERQLAGWTWRAYALVAEARGNSAEAEERYRRSREAEARGPH